CRYLDLHSFPTRRSSDLFAFREALEQCRLQRVDVLQRSGQVTGLVLGDGQSLVAFLVTDQRADGLDQFGGWMQQRLGIKDFQPRSEEHTSELQSRENLVC